MTKKTINLSTMTATELVAWLDSQNPPRCINTDESITDAHRRAGARDLIDNLINRMEREQNASRPTEIQI